MTTFVFAVMAFLGAIAAGLIAGVALLDLVPLDVAFKVGLVVSAISFICFLWVIAEKVHEGSSDEAGSSAAHDGLQK